ncbi:hypothetical protein BDR22DRAFT_960777 [Usnea florida]
MIRFLLLHVFLVQCCVCQLKQCYGPNGESGENLPCDPSANHRVTDGYGQNFDYTLNTTKCDTGTFCPQANNETCCFNHQGITEIIYHYNSSPLPTDAASLSAFYAANDYQVATVTSRLADTPLTTVVSLSNGGFKTEIMAPPSTSTPALVSPTNPAAASSTPSNKLTTDQDPPPSGLKSSAKAGIGVGVAVGGVSLAGIMLYILMRRQRRQRDTVQAETLVNAEARPPESQRYEKPELTGEDFRKELDAADGRNAELTGEDLRKELDAADGRNAELAGGEQQMRMEMEARAMIHEMF